MVNVLCISESCAEIEIKLNFYFHTSLWCLRDSDGKDQPIILVQRSRVSPTKKTSKLRDTCISLSLEPQYGQEWHAFTENIETIPFTKPENIVQSTTKRFDKDSCSHQIYIRQAFLNHNYQIRDQIFVYFVKRNVCYLHHSLIMFQYLQVQILICPIQSTF